MQRKNILEKIKKAGLTGRGGAAFPVDMKWKMVKDAKADRKFVVCNGSEGEPGIKKDEYIIANYYCRLIEGMKIAIRFLKAERGYLYLNPVYYDKYNSMLRKEIDDFPILIFRKPHIAGYVGGTETTVLNAIEGNKIEPKLRPPYPVTNGLWGYPTLVNNVETFYDVSLVMAEEYEGKRFFTINGDAINTGVYEYPENETIENVLKLTKNYPNYPFFVQVGGDASGEVLNSKQLKRPVSGAGSITIHSLLKHSPMELMRQWANFFAKESCGQCTPCREGTNRLKQELDNKEPNWILVADLLDNLTLTSFCGLGGSVQLPFITYVKNVLIDINEKDLKQGKGVKMMIVDRFSRGV